MRCFVRVACSTPDTAVQVSEKVNSELPAGVQPPTKKALNIALRQLADWSVKVSPLSARWRIAFVILIATAKR